MTPWYKRKFYNGPQYWEDKFDIVKHYRQMVDRSEQRRVFEDGRPPLADAAQQTPAGADALKRQKRKTLLPPLHERSAATDQQ